MKGGNGATIGSGITQFAEGEPKRWNYPIPLNLPTVERRLASHGCKPVGVSEANAKMKGGNGATNGSVVTLLKQPRQRLNISSRGF